MKDYSPRTLLRKLLVLTVGLGLTQASLAQDRLVLEEVVVTAQKREQNLQDVPVAVTALDSSSIRRLGILTTSDVVRITPSMTVEQSNNKTNSSFRIRGVGTNLFGISAEQAVSMIIDDVAVIQQGQSMANLIDIERIEVLRGPQSTLFGKAASAGVVNIMTKNPTEEFEGSVEATWTDENEERLHGVLSGPLGDSLGYRLSGHWYDHDGWGDVLSEGYRGNHSFEDGYGFRGKLHWDATETISVMLGAHYSEEDSDCCARTFREYDNENGRLLGFIPETIADGIIPDDDNTTIRRDTPANSETETKGASLRLNFELGEFSLLSITAYEEWEYSNDEDVDFSDKDVNVYLGGTGGWYSNSYRDLEFFSQELRLVSPTYDNYDYLVGFYYSDSDTDRSFFRELPISPSDYVASAGTESIALFGQINWHFSDSTTVSTGLRVFEEEITASAEDFAPGATPPASGDDTDSDVVGKISVQHNFTDEMMVFVSYTRGYKGQAFDITSEFDEEKANNPVAPEESDSFELGLKSTLWDGRMQLNATAFYAVYDDFQVQSTNADEDGLLVFRLDNVGELETRGVELETVTLLSEEFTLTFNAAYIDAEVNDYTGADCWFEQTEEQGCDIDTGTQTVDGGTLPSTPEWKYTAMLDYSRELSSLPFDFYANAIYTWQDEIQFGITQNPRTMQDSYGITNLRAGIRDKSERYEITAFVNNAFDEDYVGAMLDGSFLWQGTSVPTVFHMVPRNSQRYWGLRAKYNF